MSIFERASVQAWRDLETGVQSTPEDAWREAIKSMTDSQKTVLKGCTRSAFADLYRAEALNHDEVNVGDNGRYALRALRMLQTDPSWLNASKASLWRAVRKEGEAKNHNGQLDVVLGLVRAGIL